ncbi:hypothetical protein GGH12_004816 [Coemansia sp. RSA 1822]|nr:hypothetical protein GGH12_004816 [Coemansia sp. RSA 1822]
MQISMVRHLTDTRKRTVTLDTQYAKLAASYEEAHQELDTVVRDMAEDIDSKYHADVEHIREHMGACAEWRTSLEDTASTVQQMVEELPPTQLVAKRDRVLALLSVVERTRPHMFHTQSEPLVDIVRPPRQMMEFYVPRVLELGRKRGHVRVQDSKTAFGLSWHIEARRTRGSLGDPCLSITLRTSSSHVARVYLTESSNKHFVQERIVDSQAEFTVCSLKELENMDVLDSLGGVTVHWDVRAQSYKELRQLSAGSQCDELEDWTFLDSVHQGSGDTGSTAQNMWALLPSKPLPPVPNTTPILPNTLSPQDMLTEQTVLTEQELKDGFAFDGLADIEREQAKIDARHSQHPDKMHARCTSLLERIDALHLIANTMDNSRGGMAQTSLRRISSELGIGTDHTHSRRSITLDPQALTDMARSGIPHAQVRRMSATTQSPARMTKPKLVSHKLGLPVDSSATLTPQATRRGGILKPGRSQRRRAGETIRPIRVVTPSYGINRGSEHTAPVSPSSSCASIARQVRSACVTRKQVRFPEEQRLLESIRLIDPRTAQCIESRSTSADSLPSVQDPSSSISSLQGSESITSLQGSESNPSLQGSESNPSLQGSESNSNILEPDTLSSVFDSVQPRYTRPPIPRLVHEETARLPIPWSLHSDKVVRSKGGVIFDHAALSPTLAAMGQQYTASNVNMGQQYNTTNSSGMEVGPNISSTQSSPAPTRISSKCPSASPSPPSS